MGDIKRFKKKYTTPSHPWNATRIKLERDIKRKYGVANKAEIWKMESFLKSFKDQAKGLLTRIDEQANKEREQMIARMTRLGLIKKDSTVDDVLGLQLKDIMNRRLQTIVLKRRLARSIKHARQLITHQHIMVGDRKVTSPSYIVLAEEEAIVGYAPDSAFTRSDHPEAFDEEIMKKKLAGKKRDKTTREENIVVFDEEGLEDPEEKKTDKSYNAAVQDLGEAEDVTPVMEESK